MRIQGGRVCCSAAGSSASTGSVDAAGQGGAPVATTKGAAVLPLLSLLLQQQRGRECTAAAGPRYSCQHGISKTSSRRSSSSSSSRNRALNLALVDLFPLAALSHLTRLDLSFQCNTQAAHAGCLSRLSRTRTDGLAGDCQQQELQLCAHLLLSQLPAEML